MKYPFLFLTLFLTLFCYFANQPSCRGQVPDDTLKIRFKRYVIKKYQDSLQGNYQMKFLLEGKEVLGLSSEKSGELQVVGINNKFTYDITQDSVHNFIFQRYFGGEKQETHWYIVSLGRFQLSILDTIKAVYSTPWLGDFGNDGRYEIVVRDYTFAHWNASFLDSPYEEVIMRYQNGKYRIAQDLMLNDSLSVPEEVVKEITDNLKDFYETSKATYPYTVEVVGGAPTQRWGFITSKLWGWMMKLIYAGQGEKAQELVEQVWYEPLEGKEVFLDDFQNQLKQSPFWPEIRAMNNGQ